VSILRVKGRGPVAQPLALCRLMDAACPLRVLRGVLARHQRSISSIRKAASSQTAFRCVRLSQDIRFASLLVRTKPHRRCWAAVWEENA